MDAKQHYVLVLWQEICRMYSGDVIPYAVVEAKNELLSLEEQLESARADSARAVYIAENLFQMIDPQTWRDSGGDDGQGHYEGEYRAEQLREELVSLAAANSATEPDPTEGLPPDLARILCDPTIIIDRDHEIRLADGRTLFEHIHEWQNAPSNTAGTLPRHGVQSASEKERDDPNPATAPEVDDG